MTGRPEMIIQSIYHRRINIIGYNWSTFLGTSKTSSYPGWIKSPHVVTLRILKLSDLDPLTIFMGGGVGYSGVNFGHPKSEVFQNGGGGYSGVNFGHPKSEVFQNGGVFQSKLWSS